MFNNTGGNSPTVYLGTGVLTLTGNPTATSNNLGAVSTIFGGNLMAVGVGGSNVLTLLSGPMAGLAVGSIITGSNIPANTVVTAIVGDKITMSAVAGGTVGAGFTALVSYPTTGTVALSAGSHTFDTVSYTHLDVYKRQPFRRVVLSR